MSFTRVYIPQEELEETIEIKDRKIINKLRNVLRLKKRDKICVFDGESKEYLYEVWEIEKDCIKIKKIKFLKEEKIFSCKIYLAFPLFKKERIEFILEKATELGVFRFFPYISERTVISKAPSSLVYERWRKIIIEATRQSQRILIPFLERPQLLPQIIKGPFRKKIVTTFSGNSIKEMEKIKSGDILLVIGPEGDFSPSEYDMLKKEGVFFLKLSPHILRVETAAIFSVGLVNYFLYGLYEKG